MPYPPITLDRRTSVPLYRQIEVELRRSILDGRLVPGTRLPGIRTWARHLGVGAVTVMTAYDQLAAEGYLEPRPGHGTLVAVGPGPVRATPGGRRPGVGVRGRGGGEGHGSVEGDGRGAAGGAGRGPFAGRLPAPSGGGPLRPLGRPSGSSAGPRVDFRLGAGSPGVVPAATWERLLVRACRDLASAPSGGGAHPGSGRGDARGDARLRRELAAWLGAARAVRGDADRVVVTGGSRSAVAAAASLWLGPDRPVAVEDPGSRTARRGLATLGVPLSPVPVDDRGLQVDRLPADARAVLVTPSWQRPGGGTMPVARRLQLLAWAAAHDALVVEDDADAEPRLGGAPLPSIQGLDDDDRVCHLGSPAPGLAPGLALGWAVVPADAVEAFAARLEALSDGPAAVVQRAMALFLAEGHLERALGRLRVAVAERQAALLAALDEKLGAVVSARPASAGRHLVVRIEDPRLPASVFAVRARALGVAVEPLAAWRAAADGAGGPGAVGAAAGVAAGLAGLSGAPDPADRELVIAYAHLTPEAIRDGVRRLARAAGPAVRASA